MERFTAQQLTAWRNSYGWDRLYTAQRLGLSLHGYEKKEQGQRHVTVRDMKLIGYVDRDEAKKRK